MVAKKSKPKKEAVKKHPDEKQDRKLVDKMLKKEVKKSALK